MTPCAVEHVMNNDDFGREGSAAAKSPGDRDSKRGACERCGRFTLLRRCFRCGLYLCAERLAS